MGENHQRRVLPVVRAKPYKSEAVSVFVSFDKFADIPIVHPVRYHDELRAIYSHS